LERGKRNEARVTRGNGSLVRRRTGPILSLACRKARPHIPARRQAADRSLANRVRRGTEQP